MKERTHLMRLALRAIAGLTLALAVFGGAVPTAAADTWTGRYSVYTAGVFSMQHLDFTCVGASTQMILNIITGETHHSAGAQKTYWSYGHDHDRYLGGVGVDPVGWVTALEHFGAGNYSINAATGYQAELQALAAALRAAGRPVGLFVHHGGHAWVMTGFEATADPQTSADYQVTAIQVMGPLYPYGTFAGKSYDPAPGTWFTPDQLRVKFTPIVWKRAPEWDGRWVAVVPD
jgi:hypothetical protein